VGTLQYDGILIEFDDRLLAHLQIVIVQKIRRGESFLMSWRDSSETGSGRSAIWIHPTQNLYFKFYGSRPSAINLEWVEELMNSANSPRGLLVMAEGSSATEATDGDIARSTSARRRPVAQRVKVDPASPE